MDHELLLKVSRQLRTVKWLLSFLFLMLLAGLVVLGFIAYTVLTFTQHVTSQINSLESKTSQNLDFKNQICSNKSITTFLGSNNDLCAK